MWRGVARRGEAGMAGGGRAGLGAVWQGRRKGVTTTSTWIMLLLIAEYAAI